MEGSSNEETRSIVVLNKPNGTDPSTSASPSRSRGNNRKKNVAPDYTVALLPMLPSPLVVSLVLSLTRLQCGVLIAESLLQFLLSAFNTLQFQEESTALNTSPRQERRKGTGRRSHGTLFLIPFAFRAPRRLGAPPFRRFPWS